MFDLVCIFVLVGFVLIVKYVEYFKQVVIGMFVFYNVFLFWFDLVNFVKIFYWFFVEGQISFIGSDMLCVVIKCWF